MSIHSTAVIEKGAELGEGVSVGPFAYIASGANVGDACNIGPHAVIHSCTTLGRNGRVHVGAILGDLPQDTSFDPAEETFVEIGDDCTLREGVTVNRGSTKENRITRLGNGCFLMAFSHVAHDCMLSDGVIMANGAVLAGHVHVGERTFISANTGIQQWTRVGRLAMLGGNASITKDIPPFCLHSSGAKDTLCGLNTVGLRRGGLAPSARSALKAAYKTLFTSGLNISQAVAQLEAENPQGAVLELLEFVKASKRGVCTAGNNVGLK